MAGNLDGIFSFVSIANDIRTYQYTKPDGSYYTLRRAQDGTMDCNCPATAAICKHMSGLADWIKTNPSANPSSISITSGSHPVQSQPVVFTITKDGFAVDEDGVIIGMVDDHGKLVDDKSPTRFTVTDWPTFLWFAERVFDQDSEITKIENRIANLTKMMEAHTKRREYLIGRFGADAQVIVGEKIKGTGLQSVMTEFGRTGFRANAGSVSAIDQTAAIEWAKSHGKTDAIETIPEQIIPASEKLLPSALMADGPTLPKDIFEYTAPYKKFYLSTKVAAKKADG